MKNTQMKNRKGESYNFTGKRGTIAVANQNFKFGEENIRKGDQFVILADEIFILTDGYIKTSSGMLPSKMFHNEA